MEDYSQTEDVANWIALSFEIFEVDDLRGYITWSAASHEQVLWFIGPSGESEISDDTVEISLLPEQDILWFEIAMHDFSFVHMLQSHKEPTNGCLNFVSREFVFGFDFIVKLPTLEQLHTDIDGVLTFVHFKQLH